MSLSTLGRQLLLEAQLGAPPFVQKRIISRLNASKQTLRSVLKPYFKTQRLEGKNEAGPLSVTYVGLETAALNLVKKHFFREYPRLSNIEQVSISKIQDAVDAADSDLVIVVAGKHITDKLPKKCTLLMPSRVIFQLDIRGSWEDVKGRFRRNVITSKLRLVRKYGYTYRISHDLADLEHYHDNMYVKLMNSQHEELSAPWPKWQSAAYFKHGFLFLAERDGQDVAGILSHPQQKMLTLASMGVLNADRDLLREGALIAAHVFWIEWANEHGFETLDFMDTQHNFTDGVYRAKRQWGAEVFPPKDDSRMWMKIKNDTPAVRQCLKDNPLIVIGDSNKFQGLITVDDTASISDKDKKNWEKWYATPGVEKLLAYSIEDLLNDPVPLQNAKPVVF